MKIRAYADLHLFYSKDDMNRYITEELNTLKETLLEDKPDLLVFCGDLTHTSYNSDDIRFIEIMKFINSIVEICEKTKVPFRMIRGTVSHDGKIVDILHNLYKESKWVKFITKPYIENFSGYKIRYLPEQYYPTYAEFKNDCLNEIVDITFFHGTVSGVLPMVKQVDSVTNLPKSIVIDKNDLINTTRYFSAGGHIHQHIDIEHKIFYINSLTTHNFSDIDNIKGYMEFTVNKNEFTYDYIANYNAPKYLEYTIHNIHTKSAEDMKTYIANIVLNVTPRDHIRFTVNGRRNMTGLANLAILKSLVKKYNIKIKTVMEDNELTENLSSDFDYFVDKSISYSDKIAKLAYDKYGITLSNEFISEIIKIK